jgi:hypothetical protein
VLISAKISNHELARQRIESKAKLRVSEDMMKLSRSTEPTSLHPLDGIAETVSLMSDQKRIQDAKARVHRIAEKSKRGQLPPVKRLSTIEFARKELQSLETHLR